MVIGNGVTTIERWAFYDCISLAGAYFKGNAPTNEEGVFFGANNVTIYYLPGTTGWGSTFADRSTAVWATPVMLDGTLGIKANALGFTIAWAPDVAVVVEASASLTDSTWSVTSTNVLTGGVSEFIDPEPPTQAVRFYRLRAP